MSAALGASTAPRAGAASVLSRGPAPAPSTSFTTSRRPMPAAMAMATTTSASSLSSLARPCRLLLARRRRSAPLAPPVRATNDPDANNANNAPADAKPRTSVYNTEFGYTRKDIFLLGAGLIALGYVMYYGLQATGMDAGMAGNWVQLTIFLGICVGYVSTYVYRVATKQMTYVKQLEQYEEAVMRRRLEEMTEAEVSQMVTEADAERAEREARRAAAAAAAAAAADKQP